MWGFNVNKLKPSLKMAVHRINIVKSKKANTALVARREIARLLGDGKEEKARLRVEGIIRDDFTVEGYEILELLCDLICERVNLIQSERECPYDMREAVCTLIWAATRTEIPELQEVKKQLTKKYGQDFAAAAMRNADGCVNERVMLKLSVQPPSAYLVVNYMKEIAKQFNVDWEPDESTVMDPLAPIPAPTGVTVVTAPASGPDFAALYAAQPPPGKIPSALPNIPSTAPADTFTIDTSAPPPPLRMAPTAPPQAPAAPTSYHAPAPAVPPPAAPAVPPPAAPAPSGPAPLSRPGSNLSNSSGASSATASQPFGSDSNNSSMPDFDELTARFERLRQKHETTSTNESFSI